MATRAILEAGFDENRFENPVSENFKCSICLNVLNEPKSCRNNQHYFCFGCIGQHLENFHTCPECMEELTPETLGTPPRVLMNCIAELPIKCNYSERGCSDRVQLGRLQNHLDQCGFAPVTCGNDRCEMKINKRDRIHHETELCEFRRVQCHNCGEVRKEMVNLGEKQDQLNKSQTNLEVKIDQVSTRLQNIEKNIITKVNELYLSNQREKTSQMTLREQEEISSELENALGEKEKQCLQMEVKVREMKREKRLKEGEFEQRRKDYEKKIHDLKKVHVSLEQEVKTLREKSRQTSSRPLSETTHFDSQLDELIPERFERRQGRSDIYGSEPLRSPRRRLTTADDVTLGTSDHDDRRVLPKRSHSSGNIRNEFLDATQNKVPGSQELDRRSKYRSRLYHSGSCENLNSRSGTS